MNGFDEAWYRDHQAKMTTLRSETVAASSPGVIEFTIGHATILLNPLLRMHWAKRRQYQKALSKEIAGLTRGVERGEPFRQAKVTVTRYSVQLADPDNLPSACKSTLDCLVVKSSRNPDGIGLIVNDDAAHLVLDVRQVRVSKRLEQRTEVRIERLT